MLWYYDVWDEKHHNKAWHLVWHDDTVGFKETVCIASSDTFEHLEEKMFDLKQSARWTDSYTIERNHYV